MFNEYSLVLQSGNIKGRLLDPVRIYTQQAETEEPKLRTSLDDDAQNL